MVKIATFLTEMNNIFGKKYQDTAKYTIFERVDLDFVPDHIMAVVLR